MKARDQIGIEPAINPAIIWRHHLPSPGGDIPAMRQINATYRIYQRKKSLICYRTCHPEKVTKYVEKGYDKVKINSRLITVRIIYDKWVSILIVEAKWYIQGDFLWARKCKFMIKILSTWSLTTPLFPGESSNNGGEQVLVIKQSISITQQAD